MTDIEVHGSLSISPREVEDMAHVREATEVHLAH
jgi:hypothetical protein